MSWKIQVICCSATCNRLFQTNDEQFLDTLNFIPVYCSECAANISKEQRREDEQLGAKNREQLEMPYYARIPTVEEQFGLFKVTLPEDGRLN